MANILFIISGSIACYKIFDIISTIKKDGHSAQCILTRSSENLISTNSLAILTGQKVLKHDYIYHEEENLDHIDLSRKAHLIVILPATGNIISKIANGIADDFATSLMLANKKQVLIFPAMNPAIWENSAIQSNIKKLKKFQNIKLIDPIYGETICKEKGIGHIEKSDIIIDTIRSQISKKKSNILITNGPTKEYIDDVRFITNRSSGKQGNIIAKILASNNNFITLISSLDSDVKDFQDNQNIVVKKIDTACEMLSSVQEKLSKNIYDAAIFVAAVCDWKIKKYLGKIAKNATTKIEIEDINKDILSFVTNYDVSKKPKKIIGFCAESGNLKEKALIKIKSKNCDYMIANDISNGKSFNKDESEIIIINRKSEILKSGTFSKIEIAEYIRKKLLSL
ncbi:bifunctional phosphopantothenoylcysteine decarboxylase/phosphopantothenate--cysteine ligase CoaBC [Anaplasmataceae bacterium AB001_6]|nr:bifunctional phosphopantothenoylcysteine decarboxylase/phosphopantothenate--cysteine ligase CoaBC [Anaplasmataceae bacterium AB001_6]